MTLPAGVTTFELLFGKTFDFEGTPLRTDLVITPSHELVYEATGDRLVPIKVSKDAAEGEYGSVDLPHTDQSGFVDLKGNEITDWWYTVQSTDRKGRTAAAGTKTRKVQATSDIDTVDLDLIPIDGTVGPVGSTPLPPVTSVNGETGAVLVAGATDTGIAEILGDPDSESATVLTGTIDAAIGSAGMGLDTIVTATIDGGDTYVLDPTLGDQFILTLTGDATLTVPSYAVGSRFLVQVNQDATGGHTLTLPTAVGPEITLDETANTYELLVYRCWTPSRLDVSHPTVSGPIDLPFGPGSVLDGLLWLDAESIAGDAGDEINTWTNEFTSSSLVISSPASPGKPKLAVDDGINVVTFDGTDYFSSGTIATLSQPFTLIALFKTDAPAAARQALFAGGVTGAPMLYVDTSGSGSGIKMHAGSALVSGVNDDNSWTIVAAVFNNTTSSIAIDGDTTPATGTAGAGSQTSIRIGRDTASAYLIGQIAMLVMIGHVSDADEIANVVALMQAKKATLETT